MDCERPSKVNPTDSQGGLQVAFEFRSGVALEMRSTATARGPRFRQAPFNRRTVGPLQSPFGVSSFGPSTDGYPRLPEPARHSSSIATQFVGQLLHALPGEIALDEVIKVGRRFHSGLVYDFQSDLGYFFFDGIIGRNCHCSEIPIIDAEHRYDEGAVWNGAEDPDDFEPESGAEGGEEPAA
jgi:hypothetical protein